MAARSRTLVVGVFVFALAASACDLPSLHEARESADALPETSFIYSADGALITALHAGENRVVVRSRKIPDVVRDAVIAIEDQRFYDHSGLDVRALLRAAYIDATTGEVVEGGSTITQQLVKKLYVGDEQTVGRKVREAYLAWQLEQRLSKDRILTRYLNTVYFGNGAYGILAASETYFGLEPLELTLSQAATLAGLVAAPVDYDPVRHPGRSERRRNHVLTLMLGLDMIDEAEFEKAIGSPIVLDLTPEDATHYPAPWFVDYVKEWFLSNPRFGETPQDRYDLLFEGGLRIVTTVDLRLQRAAERAIGSVLTEPADPYGALTAIDPRTGYVRAMVGGRDYWNEDDEFARINLATGGVTGRQAGSAFKPFALVAALEHGIPRTQPLNGSTAHILLQDGTYWDPHNAEGSGYGTISLESATVNSVNVAYANLLSVIGDGDPYAGAAALVETADADGHPVLPPHHRAERPARGRARRRPGRERGEHARDGLRVRHAREHRPARAADTRDLGDHVRRGRDLPGSLASRGGGGTRHRGRGRRHPEGRGQLGHGVGANIGRPQFGKTGTAQNASDAWFVGAIPQMVTAVWVGFPQGQIPMCCGNVRISTVYGGTWPASIWRAFMLAATRGVPVKEFGTAPNVDYVTLRVDVTQGCLANPYTPPGDVDVLQFPAGAEPTLEVCTEPSSYELLVVPSVIGLERQAAISALHYAGFTFATVFVRSDRQPDTVIAQDPGGGSQLIQGGTVTITVARGAPEPSPAPDLAPVPNVVGMQRGAAEAAIRQAGFVASVSYAECDPDDPSCDDRPGVVWSQSPDAGAQREQGSTVTIFVNP